MFPEGSLADYYRNTYLMIEEHNFSLTEIENMLPFELTLYSALIINRENEIIARNNKQRHM